MLKFKGNKAPFFCTACRTVPLSPLPLTEPPCGLHSVVHNDECVSFASYFHFSDIKDVRLSRGPCSAVFLFLAVHGQTCSVIGFKFLHHERLVLGFLQPCQISTDFHQRASSVFLTTLYRPPCYSPYEALAPPFHNEAVKKRGAD